MVTTKQKTTAHTRTRKRKKEKLSTTENHQITEMNSKRGRKKSDLTMSAKWQQ